MSIKPGDSIVLSVPLPPKGCTAQQGQNRFVRANATSQARADAFIVAKKLVMQNRDRFPLTYVVVIEQEWHVTRNHGGVAPTDPQNMIASLKGTIDGFVDAGLLADDSFHYVQWGKATRLSRKGQHCGVPQVRLTLRVTGTPIPQKKAKR